MTRRFHMSQKVLLFVAAILVGSSLTFCHGWMLMVVTRSFPPLAPTSSISQRLPFVRHYSPNIILHMSDEYDEEAEDIPCWQQLYDDDCAMASAEAATFVASKWIKSMPCAEGIEDCDMPADLQVPGMRKEAGIDHVDVMGFLGLKKAKGVGEEESDVVEAREEYTDEDVKP